MPSSRVLVLRRWSTKTLIPSIWLFDVRESVGPSARLEGFDISFDAAPPKETLPSNVSFRHWDVNQDLPEDLVGAFDIVHVRFFAFVLMNDQVQPVVERLFKMLSTYICHARWPACIISADDE